MTVNRKKMTAFNRPERTGTAGLGNAKFIFGDFKSELGARKKKKRSHRRHYWEGAEGQTALNYSSQ